MQFARTLLDVYGPRLVGSRQYRRNPNVLVAQGYWSHLDGADEHPPSFAVAREHYTRLAHLLDAGVRPRLEVSLAARFSTDDSMGYNVVAEIPGTDPRLAVEVVMLGGHFDSWHAGTGATDNAAGSAVAMEAMRILKAIGARPRRTIRIALWDGEEASDNYAGSEGYVRRHFADLEKLELRPEHAKLSAYFNLDNGTGRIRGVYLQGNEAARPIFTAWLAPFRDLKQAAVVMAAVVYHTTMRLESMPRLRLPAPRGRP
ncbi:MAG: M20/M25/M40 family metallo-hydrolase [Gemmatimonadetes bacterium]|nr:M20/M25/M40 family metallo-hydrolase [Gemmatimonadota bacterium]